MAKSDKKGKIGSSFDGFLQEEGRLEEATQVALKRIFAYQLEQAMAEKGISKTELAARLNTSRSQVDRLLDPNNEKTKLSSLEKVASAVGKTLYIGLQ